MSLLFRWQGATLTPGDTGVQPQSGYGDFSAAYQGRSDLVSYAEISAHSMSTRTVNTVRFRNTATEAYWQIRPDLYPSQAPSRITTPWSARLYWRRSANHATRQPIIRFREGNTTKLYLASDQNNRFILPGATGQTAAVTPHTAMYRMELQVDPDRDPKVVWRVYLEDNTTPVVNRTASPADVAWDNILLGHMGGGMIGAPLLDFADIEIHDDYDLGGQFTSNPVAPTAASVTAVGAPSSNPIVDARFNYDAEQNRTTPAATPSYTLYGDIPYSGGGGARVIDLYVPDGTPPAGGWPVVMWAHSGFFTGGSKSDLPTNWRDDLLAAGYAVASVGYVKSEITAGTYPSYPSAGRYPSHIMDYKRAGAYLRDNAATWGLNPEKLIATGFSAGGYIALGAALTRDLEQDAAGNPMSLAAATAAGHAWGFGYTGPDPEFRGCFVYAAATDLDAAIAFDPTSPNSGSIMAVAYRAFQGMSTGTTAPQAPHTTIANLAAMNVANACPVAYVRGTSDYLVHWEHEERLSAALVLAGVPYDHFTTPNNHDAANEIYDRDTILDWLEQVLSDDEEPSGPAVYFYDGVTEHPVDLVSYDGVTEHPVNLTSAP